MKVLNHQVPPNWDKIIARFPKVQTLDVCITYGDKIYIPRGGGLADHVIPHEEIHERQQAAFPGGIEAWWAKYLESAEFRFQEELEAYRVQVQGLAGYSRQDRRSITKKLAQDLAGPMYGNLVNSKEALELIISK